MSQRTDANEIDSLVRTAVFGVPAEQESARRRIRRMALQAGVFPASIQGLYVASGKGLYRGITVPAMNIRGITYAAARTVFRTAMKLKVGTFIFEIARSEIGYTAQRPAEYAVCILAAAIREGFRGPVFIQGDHFQVNRGRYAQDPEKEVQGIRDLIKEAVEAWFFNIDIDASTIVDLSQPSLEEEQDKNCRVTADMTRYIRSIEPAGLTVSVGGEIGEVGGRNSTVADLRAFMAGYRKYLGPGVAGISKISVQTGTSHGGVVLPDGTMATVELDFNVLEQISKAAREDYGLGGAVQHGASTLPDEAFHMFPPTGTCEVHLATGFQNIIYDSPAFPADLRERIVKYLFDKEKQERAPGDSDEQFLYKARKRAFGPFKKEMWDMPEPAMRGIQETLGERFELIFRKLNVTNTVDLASRYAEKLKDAPAPSAARTAPSAMNTHEEGE